MENTILRMLFMPRCEVGNVKCSEWFSSVENPNLKSISIFNYSSLHYVNASVEHGAVGKSEFGKFCENKFKIRLNKLPVSGFLVQFSMLITTLIYYV